ncbi:hypothetical protein BCR42DRAFT_452793 [Absidia repens]|uniref:Rho-GAP domain-containing protein n=1 Tax=Absidia repens TaxID=90262 RepID=A0A1X2ID52_9FUNG|nr:hypothetical protein BCR42DRAFT_452793 [Absidia repens]
MFYSFAFTAHLARLCMDDIIKRGLFERKILRKSVPNNVLFIKAFYHQVVTAEDLEHFSVHSVATLLQDALWGCKERILSKKIWRQINYETCTLEYLFTILPQQNYQLLTDIVHFLVNVMKHKRDNLMDAYHLGDAMGKVALGPADCDPILAEKAGHFLMRMIIEESKQQKRISVSHAYPNRISFRTTKPITTPTTTPTLTKTEAAKAKAKSYNRILQRRKIQQYDWTASDIGLKALHDGYPPSPPEKPYHSIFDTTLANDSKSELAYASPILFRILVNANQNATSAINNNNNNNSNYDGSTQHSFFDIDSISQGKSENGMSSNKNKEERVAHSLCHAFDDVQEWLTRYQQQYPRSHDAMTAKSSFRPLAKLNRSLTYLKTKNLQQQQQQQQQPQRMDDLPDPWYMGDSGISQDTLTLSRGGSTLYAKHTSTIPSISTLNHSDHVNKDSSISTMSGLNNTSSGISNNSKNRLLTMRQMITDQHKKLSLSIRRDPLVY